MSGSSQVQPAYWLNPDAGIQYLINVRAPQYAMNSVQAARIHCPSAAACRAAATSQLLANVASITRINVPPVVSHYNVMPVIDVFGGVDGRDLGGVLQRYAAAVEQIEKDLPRGSDIILRGQAETMRSSFAGLGLGLIWRIVLIYLLLVVNFQSWLDPFIIITALPGALAGRDLGIVPDADHHERSRVDGRHHEPGRGHGQFRAGRHLCPAKIAPRAGSVAAALEAGAGRMRPVLMTALAMVIGMLPMSLGLGEGGEQNAPLGRAVIGGLVFATVATLFFVPVVFSFMHRHHKPQSTHPS